eukprot:5268800-Amphidinium_carterae.1
MVDESLFMKMLLHVLNVEADTQTEHWEEEIKASGACNASSVVDVKRFVAFCLQGGAEAACQRSGVVDVKHFVSFCLEGCIEGAGQVLGVLSRPQQKKEEEGVAAPPEPSNEMLAAIRAGGPWNRDKSLSISSLATAVIGKQTHLPSLEDQAGAVVVVGSREYVLGKRLGQGAGGSVFAATLQREVAHAHAAGGEESDGHDPEPMALKLVGGVGNAEFRGVDRGLAAVAVEAVAAAEVRRMAHDEVTRWEGRLFLPVLHAVGKVESMGDKRVNNMSALVMGVADGTLHRMELGGDVLVRVAWALASTLAALNKVGFIHGDLKPSNVLWKVPGEGDVLSGWPLLADFGASQHFPSFQLGRAIPPSEEVHTSAWTPKFAAPE